MPSSMVASDFRKESRLNFGNPFSHKALGCDASAHNDFSGPVISCVPRALSHGHAHAHTYTSVALHLLGVRREKERERKKGSGDLLRSRIFLFRHNSLSPRCPRWRVRCARASAFVRSFDYDVSSRRIRRKAAISRGPIIHRARSPAALCLSV